jgi:tripartite-type tricarboxylate transporter receptor subunit TctC
MIKGTGTTTMTTISRRTAITSLAAAAAAAPGFVVGAAAQTGPGAMPGQVNLVVPFPPGGSTDALARLIQAGLQSRLNATIIIENRPGGVGAIGASQAARSKPDGGTFLVTFDSHAVIPALIDKPPLDIEKDLLPVMLVGTAPYVLAVNPERPYKTFADVVTSAKSGTGIVSYASIGLGTISHLSMVALNNRIGADMVHVPFKGGAPALVDVMGGHVDMICGSVALLLPHITAGKIRPLMQMGKTRLAALPDVPTGIESGFADFEALAWWGVFAPTGTPTPIVAQMEKALRDTLSEPGISTRLRETLQVTLTMDGPEPFDKFFKSQILTWGKFVRDNKIRAE